jgi:hypothetical protein
MRVWFLGRCFRCFRYEDLTLKDAHFDVILINAACQYGNDTGVGPGLGFPFP